MKKFISLFTILLLCLSMTGCERSLPKDQVTSFLDGFKTKDITVLNKYMNNQKINALLNGKGDAAVINNLYMSITKNLTYEITSVKAKEKTAKIEVTITNVSFEGVMKAYEKESFDYVIDNLYSKKVNQELLNKKCLEIYVNQVVKASKGKADRVKKISIDLTANDRQSWDMQVSDELMDALMGGLVLTYQ